MPKQALLLYLARALAMGLGLLTQLLVARMGSQAGYGLFSTVLSLALVFNVFSDFGISLNGPRHLLAGDRNWLQQAQSLRQLLALLSAIFLLVFLPFYYANQTLVLLGALPLVLFNGFQIDWVMRANNRHDLAAYRQMLHSILGLLALFLVYQFGGSFTLAIWCYAAGAVLSYLLFYRSQGEWQCIQWRNIFALLRTQWVVFSGYLAHQLTYALPALLLLPLAGEAVTGHFSSHYLLFTSLGGFAVITMDIFMAKAGIHRKAYAIWMFLFSLPALLGLLLGGYFYPYLFPAADFEWDQPLAFLLMGLVLAHAARLIWINGLLFQGANKAYQKSSALALLLQLLGWGAWLLFDGVVNPFNALLLLTLSESIAAVFAGRLNASTHV
jgi:O-antigen/teichoic acid export membrane protein